MPRRRKARTVREHLFSADTLKSAAVLLTALGGLFGMEQRRQTGEHGAQLKLDGVLAAFDYERERADSLVAEVIRLRGRVLKVERAQRRAASRLPEAMIGPALPVDWMPQPVRKRSRWKFWERG